MNGSGKMLYEKARADLISFENTDVIATSGEDGINEMCLTETNKIQDATCNGADWYGPF